MDAQKQEEKAISPRGVKIAYTLCAIFGILLILYLIIPPLLNVWTLYDMVLIICLSFLYIAPSYATNASMVVFGRNGTPIDGGRSFSDGKRILGDGKTWQGMIGGVITGTIVGIILLLIMQFIIWPYFQSDIIENPLYPMNLDNYAYLKALLNPPFLMGVLRGFLLSLGTPIGDMIGSFFKRRFNLERGAPAPVVDQLDFLLGAILFAYIVFRLDWMYILFALLATILIHILANTVGYKMGYKRQPW
jgi:CDP-2,3-bis-(O-geranylgeranyl)-sn-glycerol synthase